MSARWKSWFKRTTTLLEIQEDKKDRALVFFDPLHNKTWDIAALHNCPKEEWPAYAWDIRLGLDFHQVLSIPPLAGLQPNEYPAYWHSTFQRSFPEQNWSISMPNVSLKASTLITACAQHIAEALQPFETNIRWFRPAWASPFEQAGAQMNRLQRASIQVWIWEEESRMLWLQRHEHPRQGWKKAVIRILPHDKEERSGWFFDFLEREALHEDKTKEFPGIVHLKASECRLDNIPSLHIHLVNGWKIYTTTPALWIKVRGA